MLLDHLLGSDNLNRLNFYSRRIKIYVPEYTRHVHHHHVKKVPVYIVTKDKPRVMHASHIEDDFDDSSHRKFPRTKTQPDYGDVLIQGIYQGDESHVHEDVGIAPEYTTSQPLQTAKTIVKNQQKLPYMLTNYNFKPLQRTGARHNRFTLYNDY